MKYSLGFILMLIAAIGVAQPPLSKRDQQRKAEFEAKIAAEEKYAELMVKADDAFRERDYRLARMTYEEAIQYNREKEQWLTSKVNDLDILMARNAARIVDSVIVKLPAKPVPSYPEPRHGTIEQRDLGRPRIEIGSAEVDSVAESPMADSGRHENLESDDPVLDKDVRRNPKTDEKPVREVKVKEDFSSFDDGITEETFNLKNHTVLRIVVKQGMEVKVFKRVRHNWGGEFYFLDEMDITKRYWTEQVEMYRRKFTDEGQ